MNDKKKEPLFHIVKRDALPWYQSVGIRAIAIVLALIVCAVVTMILTGTNPIQVFQSIIAGAFGSARKTWITFQNIAILLLISLALTPAFKMKFWNIGGEGQVLIGGLASAACMICLAEKLPAALVVVCMIVTSIAAGAFWAFIPAFFKAKWNTNETLSTLMMNYIATQLVAFFTIVWEVPKGSGKIGIINQNSNVGWLPQAFGSKYLLSILVAVLITVFMYIYLKYSKHGYEISVVGESENTAKYVGIKVEKVIMRTMALSGAVCGLVGLLLVGGINHTITTTIAGGQGFTAVMVSWMSKFNPLTMVFSSFLIIFMNRGASEISTNFGLTANGCNSCCRHSSSNFLYSCSASASFPYSFCARRSSSRSSSVCPLKNSKYAASSFNSQWFTFTQAAAYCVPSTSSQCFIAVTCAFASWLTGTFLT